MVKMGSLQRKISQERSYFFQQQGCMLTLRILVTLACFMSSKTVSAEVTLTAPSEYTVFTGPIAITYSGLNLTKPVFRVVELPAEIVKDSFNLNAKYESGEFEVQCGSIDYAGEFAFQIIEDNTKALIKQTIITVRWPDFVLTIPPSQETLSSGVVVQFEVKDQLKCNSIYHDTKYKFEVVWYIEPSDLSFVETIDEVEVSQFLNLVNDPVKLDCGLFDHAGLYQIVFKSNKDVRHHIATSGMMEVTWNNNYAISTEEDHILPCSESLKVYYSQPRCTGQNDKIRLFKQETRVDSSAAERIEKYVAEFRAVVGGSSVSFPCDMFDDTVIGYCFKYISTARNGAVQNQDSKCLSTKFVQAIAVDGGWSSWEVWTDCSHTCEGGFRTRHRLCNNPTTSSNGQYCIGESVETDPCGQICKAPTTIDPPQIFTPDPKCLCGCQIASSRGTIVTSSTCRGSSRWIITVAKGFIIKLTFEQYTLRADNDNTEVNVRDGDSTLAELIIKDDGLNPPRYVQTSQNKMWIEYVTSYELDELKGYSEGFAATFVSYPNNITGVMNPGIDTNTIWSSTILVIALLLCVIIIVAVTIFICYHRNTVKRKRKYEQQLHNQALLVNGEAHASPSHSASHSSVKGSTNVSFGDLTAGSPTRKSPSKKREYIIPKDDSPTHGGKHKRPRSPTKRSSKYGVDGGSPTRTHNPTYHQGALPAPANYSSPHSRHKLGEQQAANGVTPTSVYSISSHGYIPVTTLGSPAHTPVAGSKTANTAFTGSPRAEMRNKSFMSAVKPSVPPIAGEEDLSPSSPTHGQSYPIQPGGQCIPMDAYYNVQNPGAGESIYNTNNRMAETAMYSPHTKHKVHNNAPMSPDQDIPEKRPPVEGRDSLTRCHSKYNDGDQPSEYETVGNGSSHYYPTPDPKNSSSIPQSTYGKYPQSPHSQISSNRPEIKPLPLRSVQRPDGQSPDTNTNDDIRPHNQHTPHSNVSSELSPILKNNQLFPESLSKGTSEMDLDLPGENDFEYDDYVPDLPGSYFSMDPHAYTLTWSQNPGAWAGGVNPANHRQNRTGSQRSLGPDVNKGSMC